MCNFFSCISDGKGNIKFFKPEDVIAIMVQRNPENYDFNSHTSIAHFNKILGMKEDNWNKWEYNVNKKELICDTLNSEDDKDSVIRQVEKYLENKDINYMMNIYNRNSGNLNSGNWNSGNWNSGNRNSGDLNSGNLNSGNLNSGNLNSGNRNSGNLNSGNRNSGNRNSGDLNSGDLNSGNLNSGTYINYLCTEKKFFLFDRECVEEDITLVHSLDLWKYLKVNIWIGEHQMTDEEKKNNPNYKVTQGYLKTLSLKESWKTVPKEVLEKIKEIKNFDKDKFKEISGLDV
jgi:hypothetical protein